MYPSPSTITFGLAILSITTAQAVQLASFTPRVDIEQPNCRAAYTTNIDGCTPNDFSPSAVCSSACVQGLVKIGEVVKRVCRDVDLGETSIIGVFQNDLGIAALCPGVAVSSSTSAAPPQSSAQPPASRATTTSARASTTSASTSTSTSTSASQSQATEPSSTSSRALVYDPSPTSVAPAPTSAQPPAQSSAPPRSTPPTNAQLSNADSGGGSPFDVQAVSASSQSRTVSMIAVLGAMMVLIECL